MTLTEQINALLPQTQCTRCGFDGCKPYAEAIATGTSHNQCPPGGQKTIDALATLLKQPTLALNPDNGQEGAKLMAVIDEDLCIGCTKCIQACPVDAIAGANKLMHTVITDECTGCELCVEPCPMDCIDMALHPDQQLHSAHYQARFDARNTRLQQLATAQKAKYQRNKNLANPQRATSKIDKLAYIQAAIARKKGQAT